MTEPKLTYADECLARAEKATPGPWKVGYEDGSGSFNEERDSFAISSTSNSECVFHGKLSDNPHDCEFVAAARTDVPELARRLSLAIESMKVAVKFIDGDTSLINKLIEELEAPLEDKNG